ncbi:MAG: helix-turn-helix domain-containing protein [Candidatus Competibacteraceae bacterium]|jgi:Cu(I)-responsive transcriptional regulator|nr:helix-turn-helix domain-containing protein [Candidatus Competibacteraceae bacterium]
MNSEAVFSIGYLARETGCKVQTIRYYEQVGLMPEPARSTGNQRTYGPAQLHRLRFIRHARDLGFSQDEVRELLGLVDRPEQSCEAVTNITQRHLVEVENRIAQLNALRDEFQRMIAQCNGNRQIIDCRIIAALADHHQCLSSQHGC